MSDQRAGERIPFFRSPRVVIVAALIVAGGPLGRRLENQRTRKPDVSRTPGTDGVGFLLFELLLGEASPVTS